MNSCTFAGRHGVTWQGAVLIHDMPIGKNAILPHFCGGGTGGVKWKGK